MSSNKPMSPEMAAPSSRPGSGHLNELDFSAIDREFVRGQDKLFLLVCASSFIESGSDIYSRNLANYFADDDEVSTWLRDHWEPEELRHGRALKAYVGHVWPEFDWEPAYQEFIAEYAKLFTSAHPEPTRGQELAGRCFVEMGTTTYYQALAAICNEPVLRRLAWRIRADEVRHYKHFYAYFLRYRERERLSRAQIAAALIRRVLDMRRNDAGVAFRHVAARGFGLRASPSGEKQLITEAMDAVRVNFPAELAVRMALKPLHIAQRMQRSIEGPLATLTRRMILR